MQHASFFYDLPVRTTIGYSHYMSKADTPPKTVEMCETKYTIKPQAASTPRWELFSKGSKARIEVILSEGRPTPWTITASVKCDGRISITGQGKTFASAMKAFEKNALSSFRAFGTVLGYKDID